MSVILLIIRILLGAVFIYSGWEKLMSPVQNFAAVIQGYRVLPEPLIFPAAFAFPWLELIFGAFLLLGYLTRASAAILAGFLAMFIGILVQSVLRNLPIFECGCFGGGLTLQPKQAIFMDSGLLILSLMMIFRPSRVWSLDRRFGILSWIFLFAITLAGAVHAGSEDKMLAAQVGSIHITSEELDEAAEEDMKGLDQQIYNIKQRKLDELIESKLWQLEAKERKISVETLQKEVSEKSDVSFFDKLKVKFPVRSFLEPPRSSVSIGDRPLRGNAKAPVTIVEFSDFECPFCGRVQPAVQEIRSQYPDQVRFAFKHFPLPFHRNARSAHLASLCAEEQGAFWQYRDKLFQNQKALGRENLIRHAKDLGLSLESFENCLDQEKYQFKIDQDHSEAVEAGVTGTPAFFVNGRLVSGAQPFSVFRRIIEDELSRR